MSAEVFGAAGAQAVSLPFGQALCEARQGQLQGVLSSGDAEAGRRLCGCMAFFYDLRYAAPISFVVVNRQAYLQLSDAGQRFVDQAARRTEAELWANIGERIERNRGRTLAAGVAWSGTMAGCVEEALRQEAATLIKRWAGRSGGVASQIHRRDVAGS